MSGCLKLDEVPGNGLFHTLDLEKAFNFRGLCPLTPVMGVARVKALKYSKEYFMCGCLEPDKVPGNRVIHTLDLDKKPSTSRASLHDPHRGRCPLTPPGAFCAPPPPPTPPPLFLRFLTFLHSHLCLVINCLIGPTGKMLKCSERLSSGHL